MRRLAGICINCFGCNALEDEYFGGIERCSNYMQAVRKNTDRHIEMCKRILTLERVEQTKIKGM